jgi:hypothetical protein
MKRSRLTVTMVALAGCVLASRARADFDRHCEERPLDAAERAAAERVLSAFRTALPDAPAGWTVTKDAERVSAVACEIAGKTWKPGGKLVPQPISIHVRREYRRPEAPPRAAAEAAPVPVKAAAASGADPARRKELEARLAELQKSRKDAAREYQEARQARDGAAQEAARRRDKEIALAMRPVQEELSSLRRAEAGARAAELEAHTAAAVAHDRAMEERRTDGAVSITANLASVQVRGAEALEAGGADVAIRQSGGVVLLLGPWKFGPGDGMAAATIDASAPRTRVQTIAVEVAGNAATAEALRGKVGVAGLRPLVGR